ncbi:uncharacterized protein LOC124457671 [Xenia sp. Carnegie-2017]|uniref:uncharacterized protein LOC124457671 n=1 Tax=Xenia sp. Carnegie-2017 TaxID=2897299 RepID=UPI001F045C15|nr:uncharacterized protein LOC124457671 [Xenia sp. Carnegie-2017]XP_046863843.1 uncharacterized protein LOC124457671 [Xenia sp. Carnegie-2017]
MGDYVDNAAGHDKSSRSSKRSKSLSLESSLCPLRNGKPVYLPAFVEKNPHLLSSQLSMGQKQYLWGIARIYSLSRLKSQVQQQYQALLDYEFKKRMKLMGITEREKMKEMKDYLRYKKFIQNYDQRIPKNLRSKVEQINSDNVHKHVKMKYSTTRVCSRVDSFPTPPLSTGVLKNEEHSPTMNKRGEHIYKHIIKGWTTDPNANDVFVRGLYANPRKSEKRSEKKENSLCSSLLNDKVVARYSVCVTRGDERDTNAENVLRMKRLDNSLHLMGRNSCQKKKPFKVLVRTTDGNFV